MKSIASDAAIPALGIIAFMAAVAAAYFIGAATWRWIEARRRASRRRRRKG